MTFQAWKMVLLTLILMHLWIYELSYIWITSDNLMKSEAYKDHKEMQRKCLESKTKCKKLVNML